MNIIGDVAGNYKTLLALLKKMPDDLPVGLGDLNDRGPRSREVFDFFRNTGKSILGNHEHMMLHHLLETDYYRNGNWYDAWGSHTLKSFSDVENMDTYIDWLKGLPLFIETNDLVLTHAPLAGNKESLEDCLDLGENYFAEQAFYSVIWNYYHPPKRREKYQICGHLNQLNPRFFEDKLGDFGVCVDTSPSGVLTGIHWPDKKIYQQVYID